MTKKDPIPNYKKIFAERLNNIYSTVDYLNGNQLPPVQSKYLKRLRANPQKVKELEKERYGQFDKFLQELEKFYKGEFKIRRSGASLERFNLDRSIRDDKNKGK